MSHQQFSSHTCNKLKLVSRIFASLVALFFVFAFAPKLIDQYLNFGVYGSVVNGNWEALVMELTFWIFIIGYLISWIKNYTGGIILIVASLVQMFPFLIIDGNLGSLIFGIPILISGILFLFVSKQK